MTMHVAPLPPDFLRRARVQGLDDQGQPVHRQRAEGGEPCRDVLRRARAGEEILLASFNPFPMPGPYKEYGPIFVLAVPSDEPVRRDVLPLPQGRPEDYFGPQFTMQAYSAAGDIVDGAFVTAGEATAVVERFLETDGVAFCHARLLTLGCFGCRIERGGTAQTELAADVTQGVRGAASQEPGDKSLSLVARPSGGEGP